MAHGYEKLVHVDGDVYERNWEKDKATDIGSTNRKMAFYIKVPGLMINSMVKVWKLGVFQQDTRAITLME